MCAGIRLLRIHARYMAYDSITAIIVNKACKSVKVPLRGGVSFCFGMTKLTVPALWRCADMVEVRFRGSEGETRRGSGR